MNRIRAEAVWLAPSVKESLSLHPQFGEACKEERVKDDGSVPFEGLKEPFRSAFGVLLPRVWKNA